MATRLGRPVSYGQDENWAASYEYESRDGDTVLAPPRNSDYHQPGCMWGISWAVEKRGVASAVTRSLYKAPA